MTNNIMIKSGIDINDEQFKTYYDNLKNNNIKSYFLDLAIECKSPVLTDPFAFHEKDYEDYSVDDISFIIMDGIIIGHMVYKLTKERPVIPLSLGTRNHLDMERVRKLSGQICFNKLESNCNQDIDINNLKTYYLSNRIRGSLEYQETIQLESKINVKK